MILNKASTHKIPPISNSFLALWKIIKITIWTKVNLGQLEEEMSNLDNKAEAGLEWVRLEEIKNMQMEDKVDLDQNHL